MEHHCRKSMRLTRQVPAVAAGHSNTSQPRPVRTYSRGPCCSAGQSMRQWLVLGVLLVIVAVFLLQPTANQLADAKKIKDKKVLKTFAKGLLLQKLSTKKQFLPLPVPIPGKWQQILTTVLDSGVLQPPKGSKARKYLLLNSLDSLSKPNRNKQILSHSAAAASSVDIDNIKKLTRLAAAKYAGKLISQQAPSSSSLSSSNSKQPSTAAISSEVGKALSSGASSIIQKASSSSSSQTASDRNFSNTQRNDVLVTAFNVVKLAKQIRQLDASKLLNLSKKTLFPTPSNENKFPLLSMRINNRKTLMNNLHYIHKLTSDLHHRHRNYKSK